MDRERDEIIIDLLGERPCKVINYLLPYISSDIINKEIILETEDIDWRENYRCNIHSSIDIDEFSKITHISLEEYGRVEFEGKNKIYDANNREYNIDLYISNYSNHKGHVELLGTFTGGSSMLLAGRSTPL